MCYVAVIENHNSVQKVEEVKGVNRTEEDLIDSKLQSPNSEERYSEDNDEQSDNEHDKFVDQLLQKLQEEKDKREEAEMKCSKLENELKIQMKKKKSSDEQYEKLNKRFEVVSKKLKSAEERCKTLLDAMNEDDELEISELGPLMEDDSEEELSDEVEVEEYARNMLQSRRPPGRDSVNNSEFELGQDVMQALVATAVEDISKSIFPISSLVWIDI